MNKKFFFSCCICIIICVLSVLFYFNEETLIKSENRRVTAFPAFPDKFSTSKIHHFFTQLSQFYTDNFPHREKIILTLTTLIPSVKTENLSLDTVIIGQNDWLFLGNNYANTIDKLTGKLYYHDSDNKKYDTNTRYTFYKTIAETILSNSNEIFFLIGPNKSSIYPEFLPKTIIPAKKPFHEELTQKMQEEGLTVYYPLQDLLQAKEKALLYYVTDTHWNDYGAFIAFIHLLYQIDPSFCKTIQEEDFSFIPAKSFAGDLINIGNLIYNDKNYQDNFDVFYRNIPIKTINSEEKENNGIKIIQSTNPNALINKTVWIIGDSFSVALRPYFFFFFNTVYFTHKNDFHSSADFSDIHADYVIYETVERNF